MKTKSIVILAVLVVLAIAVVSKNSEAAGPSFMENPTYAYGTAFLGMGLIDYGLERETKYDSNASIIGAIGIGLYIYAMSDEDSSGMYKLIFGLLGGAVFHIGTQSLNQRDRERESVNGNGTGDYPDNGNGNGTGTFSVRIGMTANGLGATAYARF